ncbi:Hypothetical predicted protein [Marmota monax]|uniref:Uncharacterized protein n=1 Tax=Marmota monax TaxID=9995 RepID=A0A5E4BVU8_MARMO|nr:Hypothetical predicted protein [Marmota monax]
MGTRVTAPGTSKAGRGTTEELKPTSQESLPVTLFEFWSLFSAVLRQEQGLEHLGQALPWAAPGSGGCFPNFLLSYKHHRKGPGPAEQPAACAEHVALGLQPASHRVVAIEGKRLRSFSCIHRIFSQVLELSAEASKEAALINQEVWEEAQGLGTPSQWYFNADGTFGIPRGEPRSTVLSGDNKPHAQ